MYPILLEVAARRVVIVGGGAVAARKAAGAAEAGAKSIRVIAPDFRAEFPAGILRMTKPYETGDLKDADLVFAATDSIMVNDAVVRDARAAGILVNRADDSTEWPGDFITPATFASGSITVAVSAGSAALTAVIRDGLKAAIDPRWTAMADAMQTLRPLVKASGHTAEERAKLFRLLASPAAMNVLQESGIEGLRKWILTGFVSTPP